VMAVADLYINNEESDCEAVKPKSNNLELNRENHAWEACFKPYKAFWRR